MLRAFQNLLIVLTVLALTGAITGCKTSPKIDWGNRIGTYHYDDAIVEFGPPDKSAKLSDGTTVADWMISRGYTRSRGGLGFSNPQGAYYGGSGYWGSLHDDISTPNQYLRLTFGADQKLQNWKHYIQ